MKKVGEKTRCPGQKRGKQEEKKEGNLGDRTYSNDPRLYIRHFKMENKTEFRKKEKEDVMIRKRGKCDLRKKGESSNRTGNVRCPTASSRETGLGKPQDR